MPQVVALSKLIYEKLQSRFFLANSLEHSFFSLPYVANWRNVPLEACIRVYRKLPFRVEVMTIIKSSSDSTGTRTQNLQFRRLLLYPIELWNHLYPQKDSNLHTIFRRDMCIHYTMRADEKLHIIFTDYVECATR